MNRLPATVRVRSAICRALAAFAVAAIWFAGAAAMSAAPAESDGEVAAREVAMELAGSFTNDGYKIRDGHWSGQFDPGAPPRIVTVNLYAGNQYYFSLGATDKAKKVAVIVYDETGRQVAGEQFFQEKTRAAAGVSPVASGPYYVSVQLLEGEASDFCLVYTYK